MAMWYRLIWLDTNESSDASARLRRVLVVKVPHHHHTQVVLIGVRHVRSLQRNRPSFPDPPRRVDDVVVANVHPVRPVRVKTARVVLPDRFQLPHAVPFATRFEEFTALWCTVIRCTPSHGLGPRVM